MVAVSVAPVVPLDLLCASGTSYFGEPALPYVPGVQGVGRVVRSPSLEAGTRVWFATSAGMAPGDGSLAETCAVAADDVVPLVDAVADEDAAAVGTSGIAAWMCLTWRAGLQPGERVLVLGRRRDGRAGGGRGRPFARGGSGGCGMPVGGRRDARDASGGGRGRAGGGGRDGGRGCSRPALRRGGGRSGGRRRRPGVRADGGRCVPRPGSRRPAGQPRWSRWRRRAAVVGGVAGPLGERARLHQQRDHAGPAGGRARAKSWRWRRPERSSSTTASTRSTTWRPRGPRRRATTASAPWSGSPDGVRRRSYVGSIRVHDHRDRRYSRRWPSAGGPRSPSRMSE